MKVYLHPRCTTCKQAQKSLKEQGASFSEIDLTETSPTRSELRTALEIYGARKLFNTSGQRYRDLGLKDKIESLSDEAIIDLLHSDGMLVKRPFIVDGQTILIGKLTTSHGSDK